MNKITALPVDREADDVIEAICAAGIKVKES